MSNIMSAYYKLLSDPPYFPDVLPRDYFRFPIKKNWLDGKNVLSSDDLTQIIACFEDIDKKIILFERSSKIGGTRSV